MTCDDVFDQLTRGPFPTGNAGDELVERHLASCADCRRLAAALAPALDLLREAMPPEESFDLPGYHGQTPWRGMVPDEWHMEIESAEPRTDYPRRVIRSEHSASTPAPVAQAYRCGSQVCAARNLCGTACRRRNKATGESAEIRGSRVAGRGGGCRDPRLVGPAGGAGGIFRRGIGADRSGRRRGR